LATTVGPGDEATNAQTEAKATAALKDSEAPETETTIPLQARKGRASYLGERSIGHQDPGATSSYLILNALLETMRA